MPEIRPQQQFDDGSSIFEISTMLEFEQLESAVDELAHDEILQGGEAPKE